MPHVTANGLQICYESQGEGEPILMIMGIASQLVLWPDGFLELLAARGFRLVRFDHRDVGLSQKLDEHGIPNPWPLFGRRLLGLKVSAPYTLEDMADDVAGLMDALELESAHIVGISMGGMIAQTFALSHPTRTRTLTSIMSHTGQLRTLPRPRALQALLKPPAKTREEAIQRSVNFFKTVGSPGFPFDEVAATDRAAKAVDRSFYPPAFPRHLAALIASGSRVRRLRSLRVPTLVIHGTEDPLVPPIGGRLTASAIPGAKLKWIEGMGHDLPEPCWPEIVDAIAAHARSA